MPEPRFQTMEGISARAAGGQAGSAPRVAAVTGFQPETVGTARQRRPADRDGREAVRDDPSGLVTLVSR